MKEIYVSQDKVTWKYFHDRNYRNAWRPNNPNGLTEDGVRDVIKKAMRLWQSASNIKLVEDRESSQADIRVKFARYLHEGDRIPFDGPEGVLAHAFHPLNELGIAGDVHFDDDEWFMADGRHEGEHWKDLLWVAVHEIGKYSLKLVVNRELRYGRDRELGLFMVVNREFTKKVA